jgi:hypothetical protein
MRQLIFPTKKSVESASFDSSFLLSVRLRPLRNIVDYVHDLDQFFLNDVAPLVESGQSDCETAWTMMWKMAWPIGCTVEKDSGQRSQLYAIDRESKLADIGKGLNTPLDDLRRVFLATEELIVAIGVHKGKCIKVLDQPDPKTLSVIEEQYGDRDGEPTYLSIPAIYTLDFATYAHLLEDKTEEEEEEEQPCVKPSLYDVVTHSELIGKRLIVTGGPFKQYRGRIVKLAREAVVAELVGLSGQKHQVLRLKNVVCQ